MPRRNPSQTNRAIDIAQWGRALRMPGIDPRVWCSWGTVGTIGDDGTFDPTDENAILVDSAGMAVDVLLEPSKVPITATFSGFGGKGVNVKVPIHPGDLVLVLIPNGDPKFGAEIVRVCDSPSRGEDTAWQGSAHDSFVPTTAAGQVVSFANDRVQVTSRYPVQIVCPALDIIAPLLTLNGRPVLPLGSTEAI